jgi:hypothetical protein
MPFRIGKGLAPGKSADTANNVKALGKPYPYLVLRRVAFLYGWKEALRCPQTAGGFLLRNALSLFLGKLEILPTALERISGSGPTGVALIDGCS